MAFARVQGSSTDAPTGAQTIAVTITAVGSGNLVCGVVGWDDGAGITITGVADDKGSTYNLETAIKDTVNNQKSQAFSRTNITNGPVTITATFSNANTGSRKIIVDEFSGGSAASTDERDGTAHGGQFQTSPGTGTDAITSGTFTTATNGDLLYGTCVRANSTTVATNGTSFSSGTSNTTTYSGQTEFRVQATAGSGTAATFTQAVNTEALTFMIALKPPASGDTLMAQIMM